MIEPSLAAALATEHRRDSLARAERARLVRAARRRTRRDAPRRTIVLDEPVGRRVRVEERATIAKT